MKRVFLLFVFFAVLLSSVSLPVLANDVEGTVAVTSATVLDASEPEIVTIKDINDNLSVIQSLLWAFMVILIAYLCYKFLRIFF